MRAFLGFALAVGLAASAQAQVSTYAPPVDTSTFASQSQLTAATTGVVKSVNSTAPDVSGNVPLPSTFANTTCSNCTMADPVFTGSPTVNGAPVASTTAVASAIAAIAYPVTSVNGLTGAVAVPITSFAGGCSASAPCTVANVLANTPCSATYLGQYAVVSNLYSGASNTNEVMRCGASGSNYYWRPQRTDFAANMGTASGTLTVSCLVTPPTIFNGANLTGNVTVAMTTTNCWPGARFEYANNATLNLFGITLTGLAGSTTKALGLGARGIVIFDGTSWQSF